MAGIQFQQCGSCGTQSRIYINDEIFVCSSCNSRHRIDKASGQFNAVGKSDPIPDLYNKLKVGSIVEFETARYTVAGGLYQKYPVGYSMLWCARSADAILWIEEEAGSIIFYRQFDSPITNETIKQFTIGQSYTLFQNTQPFLVTNLTRISKQIAIGSLPHSVFMEQALSVWLQNPSGEICRLDLTKNLDALKFWGKALDTKAKEKLLGVTFANATPVSPYVQIACPSCRSTITIFAAEQTSYVACKSCRKLLSYENRQLSSIQLASKTHLGNPVFSIGDRGTIDDIHWTVIAITQKKESGTSYNWFEYTLYHPDHERHYLSEFSGHWTFLKPIAGIPYKLDKKCIYQKKEYRLFLKGIANCHSFEGEYQQLPDIKERTNNSEYIAPPELIGSETSLSGVFWFQGRYITRNELAKAFGNDKSKYQIPEGIGSSQPMNAAFLPSKWLYLFWLIPIAILFLFEIITAPGKSDIVFADRYVTTDSTSRTLTQVSPVFTMAGGNKNVEVKLESDVQGNWSEVFAVLTNVKTLKAYTINIGTEYYSGVDGDGRWEEGSKVATAVIPNVPEGIYRAEVTITCGNTGAGGFVNHVQFTRNVLTWTNFWWSVLIVSFIPLSLIVRKYFFERRRWSNSDYSPYHSEN
ncbi:MAG: DUF4178 domain-containing protein [Bacteroidota bacterium]